MDLTEGRHAILATEVASIGKRHPEIIVHSLKSIDELILSHRYYELM